MVDREGLRVIRILVGQMIAKVLRLAKKVTGGGLALKNVEVARPADRPGTWEQIVPDT